MTSNASIGLRLWEIGQFKDIAENQAAFKTLQTNDYGTNYHTKWRPVRGATQTGKKKLFPASSPMIASPNKTISTLRTSVGEFVFRQTSLGCYLELVVGNARWALGLYGTNEAAVRALKNGRTSFRTWDALGCKTAANQIGTLSRWNKGEQTP